MYETLQNAATQKQLFCKFLVLYDYFRNCQSSVFCQTKFIQKLQACMTVKAFYTFEFWKIFQNVIQKESLTLLRLSHMSNTNLQTRQFQNVLPLNSPASIQKKTILKMPFQSVLIWHVEQHLRVIFKHKKPNYSQDERRN